MNFRAGQKVVVVDDGPRGHDVTVPFRNGDICTIHRAVWGWDGDAVLLVEYEPGDNFYGFHPNRFRPLAERKTNIDVFTEILRRESDQTPIKKPMRNLNCGND